ncbi:MAG: putative toxin-antitoxin system toxin component, PIN family [Candidatus Ozemobacteraceae bacterium]
MAPKGMIPRVFLDACAWLAFLGRPPGGAGEILRLARNGRVCILSSETILEEVRKNLSKVKRTPADLVMILRGIPREEVYPSVADIEQIPEDIEPKDRHVIAAAIRGHADYLVTFDRQHLATPETRELVSFPIETPGTFLEWFRAQHSPQP